MLRRGHLALLPSGDMFSCKIAIKWPKEEPAVVRLGTSSGANNGALLERTIR
jgi:hypothetical protein